MALYEYEKETLNKPTYLSKTTFERDSVENTGLKMMDAYLEDEKQIISKIGTYDIILGRHFIVLVKFL